MSSLPLSSWAAVQQPKDTEASVGTWTPEVYDKRKGKRLIQEAHSL